MKKLLRELVKPVATRYQNNNNALLNAAIEKLPENDGITLVDIGAAGDIEPRWKEVSKHLNYVGFEPDLRSREKLINKTNDCKSYDILSGAVSDVSGYKLFHFCENPQVSSSYSPNFDLVNLFPESNRFNVIESKKILTDRLDNFKISDPDFIKLDIQGGELDALKGSMENLGLCLGLEIEVEFLQVYSGQPLFGDICSLLSEHGFQFVDFTNLCRWERNAFSGLGQCTFGDALFLKMPEQLDMENLSRNKLCSYLSILLLYRRFDLIDIVYVSLNETDKKQFSDFISALDPLKKKMRLAMKISNLCWSLINLLGVRYRSHLIY